jgi:hypothetical protein
VCPECSTSADAGVVSLSSLLGGNRARASSKVPAPAPRAYAARRQQLIGAQEQDNGDNFMHANDDERTYQQMAQQSEGVAASSPYQAGGAMAQAPTQQLPYRVSGSLELPEPAYGSVATSMNPDLAIRFTQSHLEPPEGVNAPVVPKPVWDDAQATKMMAARLKRVLKKQKGVASDMQARVDRLRLFISDNAAAVVKQAEDLDSELTKLILKRKTRGIRGKQGAPGTPGLPGPAGSQGSNGGPGAVGAPGNRGVRGTRGATGTAGHAGPAGPTGPRGLVGPRGPKGKRGELGPQGHEPGVYMATLRRPSLSSFNPSLCPDGDNGIVRLAACTSKACRLEVLHQDHWGSVCDDKFTHTNARVVCSSLGYPAHRAEVCTCARGGVGGRIGHVNGVWLCQTLCRMRGA